MPRPRVRNCPSCTRPLPARASRCPYCGETAGPPRPLGLPVWVWSVAALAVAALLAWTLVRPGGAAWLAVLPCRTAAFASRPAGAFTAALLAALLFAPWPAPMPGAPSRRRAAAVLAVRSAAFLLALAILAASLYGDPTP